MSVYLGKKVRYNGSTEYARGGDPKKLDTERVYTIISEEDCGFYTYVQLEDVPGKYNSAWFTEVPEENPRNKKVLIGYTNELPPIGKGCLVHVIMTDEHKKVKMVKIKTSCVREIAQIKENVYRVETGKTCYILEVI